MWKIILLNACKVGHFSVSNKRKLPFDIRQVRPPVGEDNFLFLENTAEVFQKNSYWGKREARRHRGNYDDHFYIHFCENLNELLIAYYDHYTIEGVPKAHKVCYVYSYYAFVSQKSRHCYFFIRIFFLKSKFLTIKKLKLWDTWTPQAFTSSLSVRDLSRQFGINSSFLNGHFSFVLVRLFRRRRRSTLKGPTAMTFYQLRNSHF